MQCPTCHRDNEIHAGPGGAPPEPGNVSFCWGCGSVGVFTALGVIRKPTPEELAKIMKMPEIQAAMATKSMGGDPVDAVNQMTRNQRKR